MIKKIVILSIWDEIWSLGKGGGVADELHFIEKLLARGIELDFLIPEPPTGKPPLEIENITYHTYPNIFRKFSRFPILIKRFIWPLSFPVVVTKRLEELVKETEPDLILGFTPYALFPLNRVGRKLNIPTAVKLFGVMYLDRFDFPKIKYLWKSFDQLISLRFPVDHYIILNDGTRGKMALETLGIPKGKISFLPNGMDVEWIDVDVDRESIRKQLKLPLDKVIVITYSRLVKSKRIEILLRAIALLDPATRSKIHVVIGGDGPERKYLENEAERLGIKGLVSFIGVIPHKDVVHVLKACDIFSATNELTNMSLPPCEAILCGVPVVAFDVSGTSEVVRDYETGLLVKDGDIKGFSEKLSELINDTELREKLGRQAKEFARGYFVSWNERIKMEIDVMEKVIAEFREKS